MVTVEMARCIAKITGDGCLCSRYVRYNNTCKELLEEFINDFKKEFNSTKITHGVTNTRTPFVQVHGRLVINKFLEYLPSYKSEDVFVPIQIFNASKDVKIAYLRALFDDEGSVNIRIFAKTGEWKRNVKIDSKSKNLLEGIKHLLSEFDIETNNICLSKNKKGEWYYLGISGNKNFIKFQSKINFTSLIKQRKLDLLIKTYEATYKRQYAEFLKLKKEVKKILKPHKAAFIPDYSRSY